MNSPIKKLVKGLNRHLPKEDIQMTNRHMKRCSTSHDIRELQIKTMMRCHYIPITTVKISKLTYQLQVRIWSNRNSHCWVEM